MLFRKLLPLFAAFAAVPSIAHAQLGIYGTYSGQQFGGITCPTFAAPCAYGNGHVLANGGTIGAYYDLRELGPVKFGVDVRGEDLLSNKRADSPTGAKNSYRQYDVLVGLRAVARVPISALHPYAEIAGGISRNNASGVYTDTTTTYVGTTPSVQNSSLSFNPNLYTTYGMFKGFVGLDIRVLPYLDIRAVELGVGEALGSAPTMASVSVTVAPGATPTAPPITTTSAATTTGTSSSTHFNDSVGAGLVFHF